MPCHFIGRVPVPLPLPTFTLARHPQFDHDLLTVGDNAVLTQIATEILRLRHDPRPPGYKQLHDLKQVWYRLRVGDYRVVYQIEGNVVYLALLGHRREIYKLLKRRFPKASAEQESSTVLLCYRGHIYRRALIK